MEADISASHKSLPPRLMAMGWVVDGRSVTGLTGPSDKIQVSLLRPPFCKDTTNVSFDCVMREGDPLIFFRPRVERLFGFHYRIETYTPAERRRYGYFTLPILHRDRLLGRLDPKAHRKERLFEIKALHLEPGVPVTEELVAELAGALRDCAAWHRTPEIVVRQSDPAELAERLEALLV